MNRLGKSLQTERKAKRGRKKTGTILQIPNLRSKVFCVFCFFFNVYFPVFKDRSFETQPRQKRGQELQ